MFCIIILKVHFAFFFSLVVMLPSNDFWQNPKRDFKTQVHLSLCWHISSWANFNGQYYLQVSFYHVSGTISQLSKSCRVEVQKIAWKSVKSVLLLPNIRAFFTCFTNTNLTTLKCPYWQIWFKTVCPSFLHYPLLHCQFLDLSNVHTFIW